MRISPKAFAAQVRDAVPGLTFGEAVILAALVWSKNRTVEYGVLADRYCEVTGRDAIDDASIRTFMKRIRPKLSASGLPIDISTEIAIGYKLVTPEGWEMFPATAAHVVSAISGNRKTLTATAHRAGRRIATVTIKVDRAGDLNDAVAALGVVRIPD